MKTAGSRAENYAQTKLESLGWKIINSNLRTPFAEIDLLCYSPRGQLVVVEVKARSLLSWCCGEDALGPRQRQRLANALEWCVQQLGWKGEFRVDLAEISLDGGRPKAFLLHKDIDCCLG